MLLLVVATGARAQAPRAEDEAADTLADVEMVEGDDARATPGGEESARGLLGDQQAVLEEQQAGERFRTSTDPFEEPSEQYWFLGLFYRQLVVPEFMLNLFLDQATGANNPAFGAEVTYRKGNFSIVGNVWYASYATYGPFQAAGDDITDTEMVDSRLKILYGSAAFLWSTRFNDVVALEYGIDVGLGFMFGELERTEAYRAGDDGAFRPCGGPLVPDTTFCEEEGGHYGVKEAQWSGGGSVPNVMPWLALPHVALRIKPIRQLQIRLEGGFGGILFFFGGGVSYGF